MEYVVVLLIESFLTWIMLLIVIPISQKLADFSMPSWGEVAWKLAVTSLAMNAATMPVALLIHPMLSWPVGMIVLWALLAKWLDVDGFGMWIIVGVSFVVRNFVIGYLAIAIGKLLGAF